MSYGREGTHSSFWLPAETVILESYNKKVRCRKKLTLVWLLNYDSNWENKRGWCHGGCISARQVGNYHFWFVREPFVIFLTSENSQAMCVVFWRSGFGERSEQKGETSSTGSFEKSSLLLLVFPGSPILPLRCLLGHHGLTSKLTFCVKHTP